MIQYVGNILFDELIKMSDSIVIYGAGKYGKKMALYLDNNDMKKNVRCICDGKKDLWGQEIQGIKIMSPEEAAKKYSESDFLIGGKYTEEMYSTLEQLHINKIHMILF